MSERDPEAGHSARLLRGLVWAGVLLAPPAGGVVLLGHSSGSVRFAVLLIAVSVVLIGASVLIRSDPVLQRMHVEDRLAEEVDALRADLRAEFARGAARPAEPPFFRDDPMPAAGRAGVPAASPPQVGMVSGGRVVAGAASVPPTPRQRGFATPMPPAAHSAPPRATAAVQYGRPDSLDEDFGASDGYHISPGGVYGGSARVRAGDYDPYGEPDGYGPGGGTYGRPRGGYDDYGHDRVPEQDVAGYGLIGGYDGPGRSTGDPNYRARRHRPSANDTNVGTYEEFSGWSDERYVHGYGRGR